MNDLYECSAHLPKGQVSDSIDAFAIKKQPQTPHFGGNRNFDSLWGQVSQTLSLDLTISEAMLHHEIICP